jgi:hypothetical protein
VIRSITTASGRTLDLDAPRADQIALADIAGGLSRVCRFGAKAARFHSVAEHAVLVSRLVVDGGRPELGLAALHHDSHEAFVGDIRAPPNAQLSDACPSLDDEVCAALDVAIFAALSIPKPDAEGEAVIRAGDERALMIEAAVPLADGGRSIHHARGLALEDPGQLGDSLQPERAAQQFIHIHEHLLRSRRVAPELPAEGRARRPPRSTSAHSS